MDPIIYQLKNIKMKKYIILVIAFLFSALCVNVFGQRKTYSFEISKAEKEKINSSKYVNKRCFLKLNTFIKS